jgi:hypothetical protein
LALILGSNLTAAWTGGPLGFVTALGRDRHKGAFPTRLTRSAVSFERRMARGAQLVRRWNEY